MLEINAVICGCGCNDVVFTSILLDGQPVQESDLLVNVRHGRVISNDDGASFEIEYDDEPDTATSEALAS